MNPNHPDTVSPIDALLRALQSQGVVGAVSEKFLYCDLAHLGYLGVDADLLINCALQHEALELFYDDRMLRRYRVDQSGLARLRRVMTCWLDCIEGPVPEIHATV